MVPARLDSTRLPKKVLIDIEGLPLVIHTCKRVQLADALDDVFLVTDSQLIKDVAIKNDVKCIMTGEHISSSDRIAEASRNVECDIVVNIQGDEPLVNPEHINKILSPFLEDDQLEMAVGITQFYKKDSQSDIKVVCDISGDLLYMSRNDIPNYYNQKNDNLMYKLCSIVPFRKEVLLKFSKWNETPLEKIEDNHFLRFLEHGIKIKAVEVKDGKISVDTKQDLEEVKQLMKIDKIKFQYMKPR